MEQLRARSSTTMQSRFALIIPILCPVALGLALGGWANLRLTKDILVTWIRASQGGEDTALHLLDELLLYDIAYAALSLLVIAGALGRIAARAGRLLLASVGGASSLASMPAIALAVGSDERAVLEHRAYVTHDLTSSPPVAARLLVFLNALLLSLPLGSWLNLWLVRRLFLGQPGASHPSSQGNYQAILRQLDSVAAVYGQVVLSALASAALMWSCWLAWSHLVEPWLAARSS